MKLSIRGNQIHNVKNGNKITKPKSQQKPAHRICNLRKNFETDVSIRSARIFVLEIDFNMIILINNFCYAVFFGLFKFFRSLVNTLTSRFIKSSRTMKHKLLILLFALPLIVLNPALSQSKEVVKTIMTNQWVTKYKKLKTDLENKAAFIKNMENLSSKDLATIKKSYVETTFMLDSWLNHLVTSIQEDKTKNLEQLANGNITDDLKEELQEIFTFYANDFSTKYEDVTGIKNSAVIGSPIMGQENTEISTEVYSSSSEVDMDMLLAKVKKPLSPSDWNSIY